MLRRARTLIPLLLALSVQAAFAAPTAQKPREIAHYGVFLMNSRIGSLLTRTYDAPVNGKPAERVESETSIKMEAFGSVEQRIKTSMLSEKSGRPLKEHMSISSMGRVTVIDATYWPDRVVCSVDAGGQKSSKVVAIPKGISLMADPSLVGMQEPKVGTKAVLHFFEPTNFTIQKVELEILKAELRPVDGKAVPAFLIKSINSSIGPSESWVDAKGHLLEETITGVGLRIVRDDVAPGANDPAAYQPPKDLALATSVKTTVHLPDARKTKTLRLRLSNLPDGDLVLSDARQQVLARQNDGKGLAATYVIQAQDLPEICLPAVISGVRTSDLGDAPYLGVNDPSIQKQAKAVAARETDRGVIARRLRAWVKQHMLRPTNVGVPRSAPEIMRSRDGVCRDYATLFTALARAAGVPTRLCSGIVYFQDGFYYHAWAECQLTGGSDGWFTFDPTLGEDFVDATHVKLAQGDPVDMFNSVRAVGLIKAEILDYK